MRPDYPEFGNKLVVPTHVRLNCVFPDNTGHWRGSSGTWYCI